MRLFYIQPQMKTPVPAPLGNSSSASFSDFTCPKAMARISLYKFQMDSEFWTGQFCMEKASLPLPWETAALEWEWSQKVTRFLFTLRDKQRVIFPLQLILSFEHFHFLKTLPYIGIFFSVMLSTELQPKGTQLSPPLPLPFKPVHSPGFPCNRYHHLVA